MSHEHTSAAGRELFVFVGHSDDGVDEARAIMELEPDLRRDFDGLAGVSGEGCPFRRLTLWEWSADAPSLPGGQAGVIAPATRRAHVGVFVFRERAGRVTREELDDLRSRAAEGVRVIAFFPQAPPPAERFAEEGFGTQWDELLRLRRELTADWTDPASRSVTPQPPYRDREHLKQIAREAIRRAMADLLQAAPRAPIPPAVLPDLVERGNGISFDYRRVLRHGLADLDGELIDHYLARPLSQAPVRRGGQLIRLTRAERLEHLAILRDGQPTVGAFLCFAPARLLAGTFASCRLHRVQYTGVDRETPVQIQPIGENLLNLFEEGMAWLTTQAGLRRSGKVGSRERDELEVPVIALREALANALVHREYSKPGFRDQPTRIEVFADRVEITSYGALSPMISVEQLNHPPENLKPVRRNPLVAEIFLHMTHAELNASGIVRMHHAMAEAGLPPPELVHDQQHGVVIVRLRRPGAGGKNPLRVFVSWSDRDRRTYGETVARVMQRLGVNHVQMTVTPGDYTAPYITSAAAAAADLVLAIVGEAYGDTLYRDGGEENALSNTWLEVQAARSARVPVLAVVSQDGDDAAEELVLDQLGANVHSLRSLRRYLLQNVPVLLFGDAAELERKVFDAIHRTLDALRPEWDRGRWRPFLAHPLPPARQFEGRTELLQYIMEWMLLDGGMDSVLSVLGMGGIGKTALVERALSAVEGQYPGGIFQWSFYEEPDAGHFLRSAAEYFSGETGATNEDSLKLLRNAFSGDDRHLLVLDGLERVQEDGLDDSEVAGALAAPELRQLLRFLAGSTGGARAVVTSRFPLPDLEDWKGFGYLEIILASLSSADARSILRQSGVRGTDAQLDEVADRAGGHPLSLVVLGSYLARHHDGDPAGALVFDPRTSTAGPSGRQLSHILSAYDAILAPHEQRLLSWLSQFPEGLTTPEMSARLAAMAATDRPLRMIGPDLRTHILERLVELGLVGKAGPVYSVHPLMRDYCRGRRNALGEAWDDGTPPAPGEA